MTFSYVVFTFGHYESITKITPLRIKHAFQFTFINAMLIGDGSAGCFDMFFCYLFTYCFLFSSLLPWGELLKEIKKNCAATVGTL